MQAKRKKLDDVLVLLTEAQIRTEERFQRTDARMDELARAQLQTGERIDKLVSAIGEMLRNGRAK